MDDLLQEFIAETREMLEALGGEIVAWEAAPDDRGRLDAIFRFVHTVKGNCGFFDLPRLAALSHAAEDSLADVRSGKRAADHGLVSAVLAIIDRIGEIVQALETGEAVASADDSLLIKALSEKTAPASVTSDPTLPAPANDTRKAVRSIRLSVDLLDRMMSGVSDMVLARNELARRLRDAPTDMAVESAFERVSGCIAEMRDAITRTRMQRIDNLFVSLPRLVRDLCTELDKRVLLEVEGGDVELDREMIEMIRDPLTHIVRNAIDHGIEALSVRAAAGKPDAGTLRVCARQSGNQILIEIQDDGRGIDGDAVARKAVASGIITAERAEALSPIQKAALIFEAGLTTAAQVTGISGRGVGMDVVRANVERIGGVVDLDNRPGQGTRFVLRVPLTLTIIPALTVSVGGRAYAIPRSAIEEIVRSKNDSVRIETLGTTRIAGIRDKRLPLVALDEVLGVEPLTAPGERTMIVLKPAGGEAYALAVDHVHDHEELVVKPAAPVVMATGLYAGTTLADDGSPILLLDPSGIAAAAGVVLDQGDIDKRHAPAEAVAEVAKAAPALLFRTLDGSRRAIRLAVVERIEDVPAETISRTAGRLRIAIGERILPLAGLDVVPDGPIRVLRLSDGDVELAYGFKEVIDLAEIDADIRPAPAPGEVAGVTLMRGHQVELVDPHWLFANHGAATPRDARLVCALPADDPWMTNILRPIIEDAGYRVVASDGAEASIADIAITATDDEIAVSGGAPVLRLRAKPEPAGDGDDSIYRYDRERLISALAGVAQGRKG